MALFAPGVLLLTSCAGVAAAPSAPVAADPTGLTATTLHDADAQLRSLFEAGLAPQNKGKGRFTMGSIDHLPSSLQGRCPAGKTRDDVEVSLFADPTDRPSAQGVVEVLTARGLSFDPWVASPQRRYAKIAIAHHGDFGIEVVKDAIGSTVDVVGWTPCLDGRPEANATMFPMTHGT